jgi:hypothetical protein
MTSRDSFDDVEIVSYGSQVKGSLLACAMGAGMVFLGTTVLWWNEARQYKTAGALKTLAAELKHVDSLDKANEGCAVHYIGEMTTTEELSFSELRKRSPEPPPYNDQKESQKTEQKVLPLRIKRVAEMFQWHENATVKTEQLLGGKQKKTTHYEYCTKWATSYLSSSGYKEAQAHRNPEMPAAGATLTVKQLCVGPFSVKPGLADQLDEEQMEVDAIVGLDGKTELTPEGHKFYIKRKVDGEETVGDCRVSFFQTPGGQTVSIVGRQKGNRLVSVDDNLGIMMTKGEHDAEEMIKGGESTNKIIGTVLRVVCTGLSCYGYYQILQPISTGLVVVPLLSDLADTLAVAIAIPLGLTSSLITIPFAKISCRVPWPLNYVVNTLYAASLIGGMGMMSIGLARLIKAGMDATASGVQSAGEGLAGGLGKMTKAYNAAAQ